MHRYAIYLRLGRGLEISKLLCLVGVTGVRTRSGKATNGRVRWAKWARWQQGGSGELCRVWLLSNILPGQISAQFVFCCSGWLIDWLISSRRSLYIIVMFLLLPHWIRRLGDKMASRRIWFDMMQDCWSDLHVVCNISVLGDWQILWAKAMETTEPPATESGLDGGCKTNASGIHLMHTSYQHV